MPRIRIKQLDERIATAGVHLGGGPERRKLEPGEVVEIEENFETDVYPTGLLDVIWQTDKVEVVPESVPVTRPLDYEDANEARFCSPNFKSRGPDQDIERDRAREAVAARMAASEAEEPAEGAPPVAPVTDPVKEPSTTASSRRATRRAAAQAASNGSKVSAG